MSAPQPFCSFLAAIGDQVDPARLRRGLRYLPRRTAVEAVAAEDGLAIELSLPDNNALYDWCLLREGERMLFVQGSFYRPLPRAELREVLRPGRYSPEALGDALNRVNGVFNGWVFDTRARTALAFADREGFAFLYYRRLGGTVWLSSSLWPLLRLDDAPVEICREAVEEMVLYGYPVGDRTVAREVRLVLPGRMVALGAAGAESRYFADYPATEPLTMEGGLRQFREAFHDHFAYVGALVERDRFVTTLTGGRDTRVILNAMLGNGIRPTALTGSGFPTLLTGDARRAAAVAHVAGVQAEIVNYTRPSPALDADAWFLSGGVGTGGWMAAVSEAALRHGDIIYYGFNDVLSGCYEELPRPMDAYGDVAEMARDSLDANYEYDQPFEQLCRELLETQPEAIRERYERTFDPHRHLPIYPRYLLQRIDTRNFRRIGSFASGSNLGCAPAYLLYDKDVADIYFRAPRALIERLRIQVRLGYDAVPGLALLPSNPCYLPALVEPMLLVPVRAAGRKAQSLRTALRRAGGHAGGGTARVAEDEATAAACAAAGLFDPAAVGRALARELPDGGGHVLSFRLRAAARLVAFARGGRLAEEDATTLFAPAPADARLAPAGSHALTP